MNMVIEVSSENLLKFRLMTKYDYGIRLAIKLGKKRCTQQLGEISKAL